MGPIILLILLGLLLLLVELLLIPGFAFTGILGVGSLAAACYFGFQNYGNIGGIITIIFCIAISAGLIIWVMRSKTWKKAALDTEIKASVDSTPAEKGLHKGIEGTTTTRLNPMGRVRFVNGVEMEVHSLDGIIEAKQNVKVAYIENEKVYVNIIL